MQLSTPIGVTSAREGAGTPVVGNCRPRELEPEEPRGRRDDRADGERVPHPRAAGDPAHRARLRDGGGAPARRRARPAARGDPRRAARAARRARLLRDHDRPRARWAGARRVRVLPDLRGAGAGVDERRQHHRARQRHGVRVPGRRSVARSCCAGRPPGEWIGGIAFSEPEAGSDLANVGRAGPTRDGRRVGRHRDQAVGRPRRARGLPAPARPHPGRRARARVARTGSSCSSWRRSAGRSRTGVVRRPRSTRSATTG